MKFILIKFGIIINVNEPVSAMKSIGMSPNLSAMLMQRLPPEVAAHKLGVTSSTGLLESLHETLVLCFRASVMATDTMVYMIFLSQQSTDDSDKLLAFELLWNVYVCSRLICLTLIGLLVGCLVVFCWMLIVKWSCWHLLFRGCKNVWRTYSNNSVWTAVNCIS